MEPRTMAFDDMIDKIIDQLIPTATTCCPFLMQEPMLESRLREILMKIKRKNWKCNTVIYTTLGKCDMKMMKGIIDDGTLDEMMISHYGKEWQPGLDMEQAERDLKELITYRRSQCRKKPVITMQCINELNVYTEVLKKSQLLADGIGVVPYDTFHGDRPLDNRTHGPAKERKPCSRLWNTFNVHSDGTVVPCCICYDNKESVGNIKNTPIKEIWNGKRLNKLRELHEQLKFNEIELCAKCNVWEWI
jgi:radical SAM protein with 4Fe4S-binding SPASM domain